MYKIAAIIGGVLLMAGVALAGAVTSVGSTSSPTIGQTIPTAASTAPTRQDDRRGREAEARGRANEPGEDVRREDRRPAEPGDDHGRNRGSAGGSQPGTGLGLAIVQTLAHRRRGSAVMSNRLEGGTRAEVRFPVAATVTEESWVEASS